MTVSEIQNGHAFFKASMEIHADLLMTMVKGIDYCTEMKEKKKDLTDVGKAGMERIDALLNHERVLKVVRRKQTPISDAEACLLGKWGYLVCYQVVHLKSCLPLASRPKQALILKETIFFPFTFS